MPRVRTVIGQRADHDDIGNPVGNDPRSESKLGKRTGVEGLCGVRRGSERDSKTGRRTQGRGPWHRKSCHYVTMVRAEQRRGAEDAVLVIGVDVRKEEEEERRRKSAAGL